MSWSRLAVAAIVLLPSLASAAPPVRLVICPPHDSGLGAAGTRIDAAIADAAAALPGFLVANLAAGKLAGPRKSGDARMETQPAARALTLAKEANATRAIAVEATPLGDGLIVYLQALEVPSGRAIGSTTVSLSGGGTRAPGDRDVMRAALMRVLDPMRYTGRLQVRVDVQGAVVQIDGHPAQAGVSELPVGTHALRVTHPAYHDFLRFLDIDFDKTLAVDVNMAAYPLAEGEMTERQRRALGPLTHRALPWWRTWWALTLAGVVLTGVTVGVVFLARPWLEHGDSSTAYNPMPQP
ncbi:MAG: hypothetical protein JWM53_2962 [bacterium]|nr:hypothetical protein [bacterium]